MRRPRAIRRSISFSVFLTIIHASIFSHLDYCYSHYAGLPKTRFSSLQSMFRTLPSDSFPVFLATLVSPPWWLFWLPVTYLTTFSIQSSSWFLVLNKVNSKSISNAKATFCPLLQPSLVCRSCSPVSPSDYRTALDQHRPFAVVSSLLWCQLLETQNCLRACIIIRIKSLQKLVESLVYPLFFITNLLILHISPSPLASLQSKQQLYVICWRKRGECGTLIGTFHPELPNHE